MTSEVCSISHLIDSQTPESAFINLVRKRQFSSQRAISQKEFLFPLGAKVQLVNIFLGSQDEFLLSNLT